MGGGGGEECEIIGAALVAALINDSIKKEIKIKPSILTALKEADLKCRDADNPFHTPYVLDVLLTDTDAVLTRALDRLNEGLGGRYKEKIQEYVNKKSHSGRYENENLEDKKYIFYAKKYAFLDKRTEADEIDLMRGLFLTESRTVEKLITIAGGRDALERAMIQMALDKCETTTIPLDGVSDLSNEKGGSENE